MHLKSFFSSIFLTSLTPTATRRGKVRKKLLLKTENLHFWSKKGMTLSGNVQRVNYFSLSSKSSLILSSLLTLLKRWTTSFCRYHFWIQQTLSSIRSYLLHLLTTKSSGTLGTLMTFRQYVNIHLMITFRKIFYIQLFW